MIMHMHGQLSSFNGHHADTDPDELSARVMGAADAELLLSCQMEPTEADVEPL